MKHQQVRNFFKKDYPRHPYQTIIIEYYINHVPMKDIIRKIGYGENATNNRI